MIYVFKQFLSSISVLKELRHDILSCFLGSRKLLLIGMKPLNNTEFASVEKHQRGKNKPKGNKDG